ncbi:hypothetical protein M409DRAFT_18602 [Zasmidium cellare ATCC 36951]|uniref:Major facilitator superfamily (MFS) profile domain-containing protein n=1 Tax=Zasmidium cellare ATCC 36951 TaxID=1080233 RepID=A0A6A6CWT3_ZASCE|nr:uncharacterized protein M409DRAFT_18602 [Zasmidium cellare ATCC 36951]KAF2171485.1 hypothetical protein M409DRAFT_18602 [Zasmidium cellare ATCC 36951]
MATGKDTIEMLELAPEAKADQETQKKGDLNEDVERTPEEARLERKLLLKSDLIILPLIFVTFLLAFLDRSDLGNAAVAGMTKDLGMSPQQLSTASSIFYATFVVFQLPGNLHIRILGPQVELALGLTIRGLFNTLICTARNYAAVVGLRLGMGAGEAFFEAAPLYLTLWYKRDEYSRRGAITFSAAAAAGALNGLIAYGIEKSLNGEDGLAAWRWLFIIEGCLSIGWAIVILLLLPAVPEKARMFFSSAEKDLAIQRNREGYNEPHAKIRWPVLIGIFRDWNTYLFGIIYSCANMSLASFSTFLPLILRTLGYSTLDAQLLTIPVYVVATISVLAITYFSDRYKNRGYFLIGTFAWLVAGWLILLVSTNQHLSFAGTFLVGAGTYPTVVLGFSWVLNNCAGFTKRAGTYAVVAMIGQCFALMATELYSDPPRYYRGNGIALRSAVVGFCTSAVLVVKLKHANEQKTRVASLELARRQRLLSIEELGNEHPDFYYFI